MKNEFDNFMSAQNQGLGQNTSAGQGGGSSVANHTLIHIQVVVVVGPTRPSTRTNATAEGDMAIGDVIANTSEISTSVTIVLMRFTC